MNKILVSSEEPQEIDDTDLNEAASAISKYTGMIGLLRYDTKDSMSCSFSYPLGRVKLSYGPKEVFSSIKMKPDGTRAMIGTDKVLTTQLQQFLSIENNEKLLWDFWNTPMEEADSGDTNLRFIKI